MKNKDTFTKWRLNSTTVRATRFHKLGRIENKQNLW
jgi:hypothetical protein